MTTHCCFIRLIKHMEKQIARKDKHHIGLWEILIFVNKFFYKSACNTFSFEFTISEKPFLMVLIFVLFSQKCKNRLVVLRKFKNLFLNFLYLQGIKFRWYLISQLEKNYILWAFFCDLVITKHITGI